MLAMELVGDGVKLVGANEMVAADGQRRATAAADRASLNFVRGFTRKYSQLAEVRPSMPSCEMRSICWSRRRSSDNKTTIPWPIGTLGCWSTRVAYRVETYAAAKQVSTVVASVWKGNRLMTPVGGGVQIQATRALDEANLLEDGDGQVAKTRLDALAAEAATAGGGD